MKQKVKDIIKNLKEFQTPTIPNELALSEAERENLYFYLTSQELENYNQQIEEKQPEEIKLKKVKLIQVYDDTNDAVLNYNSFEFRQEERNIRETENSQMQTFKDSNIKFNSLQEIKQYLKQLYNNRLNMLQVDEINQFDKQLIIQSLNIQIQEPNCDIQQITDIFLSILFKEVEFNCLKRYDYYLDSFCILIKSRIQMFMTTWSYFNITEKLTNSLPQYRLCLVDLIKEFTDQALQKQNERMYAIYFTQLRDLILKFLTEQHPLLCDSFRLFLRINHQTVLDFIKSTNKIVFNKNEIKEIIFEETTSKINQLSFLPDCQYQLTFIFYVGVTQRNYSHHCKILAKLLQDCQSNYIQHLDAICTNLYKIKNNVNVKQVVEFIGLSVTNPDMLHQKFLDLFVTYAIESNKVDEFAQEMYRTYLFRHLSQQIEGEPAIVNKIIASTFDQMKIPFIIKLLDKLPLDKLSGMILKKSPFDLNQYIIKDETKAIAIFLMKLFLKKDDSYLKNNKFELLKYFFEQISDYDHTKAVLNFLFEEQNRTQNGLIASVIMNCLKKKKANMIEEIRILLSKNLYFEDEQIIKSVELYRSIFPDQYYILLDEQTKQKLRDKRLL